MLTAKYDKDRDYDHLLSKFIEKVRYRTTKKDDDFLVIAVGETGSGKSMLMLHAYDEYAQELATMDFVSFTRNEFAIALKKGSQAPRGFRFVGNDEANISKRDALTKYNKDMIDLYFSIRGVNIFHWWNNPSIDMIDKPFLNEVLKGCFLITTKSIDRPRIYYYFDNSSLIAIFERYKNLNYKTLKKVRKKYAVWKGWFKDYKGKLKQPYLDKKNPRMAEKIEEFYTKYGGKILNLDNKTYTITELAKLTNYSRPSLSRLLAQGFFVEGEHYNKYTHPRQFNNKALVKIANFQLENKCWRIADKYVIHRLNDLGVKIPTAILLDNNIPGIKKTRGKQDG